AISATVLMCDCADTWVITTPRSIKSLRGPIARPSAARNKWSKEGGKVTWSRTGAMQCLQTVQWGWDRLPPSLEFARIPWCRRILRVHRAEVRLGRTASTAQDQPARVRPNCGCERLRDLHPPRTGTSRSQHCLGRDRKSVV